jgi:hypothetical protein
MRLMLFYTGHGWTVASGSTAYIRFESLARAQKAPRAGMGIGTAFSSRSRNRTAWQCGVETGWSKDRDAC